MLNPERTVLIEYGNTLLGRDKVRVGPVRGCTSEFNDRLLCRSIVPRLQRVARSHHLCQGQHGTERCGHGREQRQGRKKTAATNTGSATDRLHVRLRGKMTWAVRLVPTSVALRFRITTHRTYRVGMCRSALPTRFEAA